MASWKLGSPDQTSSDEDDQNDQRLEGAKDEKRSYECTFCKRGFTNAQALGGHMNIHRKDRAKAKQHIPGTTNNHYYSNDEFMSMTSSQLSTPISGQPASTYPDWDAHRNYYFQPSGSAPRLPYGYAMEDDHHSLAPRSQGLSVNHEVWGANLSLRFSPTHLEDDHELRRGVRNSDEVDLELRLGHG